MSFIASTGTDPVSFQAAPNPETPSFQTSDDFEGDVSVDLSTLNPTSEVNLNQTAAGSGTSDSTSDGGTIKDNLPANNNQVFNSYTNTGEGNDNLIGSRGNDFIRSGVGDDVVDAGDGNDVVRLGTGNDRVTLGDGDDSVYFTVDQLQQNNQVKTFADFGTGGGNDKIQFSADIDPNNVEINDNNEIVITYSNGSEVFTTKIVAENDYQFSEADIEFL